MKPWIYLLAPALLAASTVAAQDAVNGKAVFEGNCASCHSVHEQVVGPALKKVHERRDEKWILGFVKNSSKMIAAGDKQAVEVFEKFGKVPMTSFEGSLSDNDIKDVVAYVKQESANPTVTTPPPPKVGENPQTPVPASGFSWKVLPATSQLLVAFVGFLLLLVFALLTVTFFQALPLLGHLYEKPGLRNSAMARVIALLRGDTKVITGHDKNELMEDHSYDGIHEFDNDLPPWWKYSFYATIVFGVVYLLNYHVLGGQLQEAEYQAEVQQAALLGGGNGDANEKTNYVVLKESAQLEAGKATYLQNCAACHGQNGEGVVGPNLTDEFWLHGAGVNDIYKVVKHGVTSKGMVAWQGKLSHDQILEVSSFILSLQGSNPPNGKAPQGEKVK